MNVMKRPVLVLNKNFFPVNVTTVEEAIKQMVVDAVTAINLVSDDEYYPVKWEEWIELPVREGDYAVHSTKLTIRAPSVVMACNYAKVHKSRMKFTPKNVKALYNSVCAYTGEYAPDGNVDHQVPRSKGGADDWSNVVWCKREVNSKKGNRYNHEVGLPTVKPKVPPISPIPFKVRANMLPEWKNFVIR